MIAVAIQDAWAAFLIRRRRVRAVDFTPAGRRGVAIWIGFAVLRRSSMDRSFPLLESFWWGWRSDHGPDRRQGADRGLRRHLKSPRSLAEAPRSTQRRSPSWLVALLFAFDEVPVGIGWTMRAVEVNVIRGRIRSVRWFVRWQLI